MAWKHDLWREIKALYVVGQEFTLQDVYRRAGPQLAQQYPNNTRIEATIRQVMQSLRDAGLLEFTDNNGKYRRLR